MRMLVIIVFFALLIALVGCQEAPVSTSKTNNTNIGVDFLFEHEGCRVYRFSDGSQNVYYVNCGTHTQTSWEHSCGKNCTKHDTVSASLPGE